jgi:hypothetical protein
MPASDGASAQAIIQKLERENVELKIQLLVVTRDLANVLAICDGHLGEDWEWPAIP